MSNARQKIILGSRSPRRLELLKLILPAECIEVLPPVSSVESGFEGLDDWSSIEQRLLHIAGEKCRDVLQQLQTDNERPTGETDRETGRQGDEELDVHEVSPLLPPSFRGEVATVITADTVIVVTNQAGSPVVLGQPPEDDWQATVRSWFCEYYAGKTHIAATGLCVATPAGKRIERVVKSNVTFIDDVDRWLDWYIETNEPLGKAGGYALQGAGGIFVSHVEGSISNVVGLPLRELLEILNELEIDVD